MFCPKCGTNVPDDQKFCSACGTQIAPAPAPAAPAAPAVPAKKSPVPIYITFILSLLILLGSVVIPLTKPVEEVPILNAIMTATMSKQEWIDAIKQEELVLILGSVQQEESESAEHENEDANEPEPTAAAEVHEHTIEEPHLYDNEGSPSSKLEKAIEKLESKFTVLNLKAAFDALDAVGKTIPGYDNTAVTGFSTVMTVILAISIGAFALPLLFTLLGGLKKSTGLTITALVLTAIPQLLLSGAMCFLGSAIVLIIQAVLCSGYKKYQKHLKESTQQL